MVLRTCKSRENVNYHNMLLPSPVVLTMAAPPQGGVNKFPGAQVLGRSTK